MDWLAWALIAHFIYAISNINTRVLTLGPVRNGRNYLILFSIIWLFFLMAITVVYPVTIPSVGLLGILVVNGLITAVSLYSFFVALATDDASRVAILLSTSPIFAMLLSAAFLGEAFPARKLLGLAFLIMAGAVASVTRDLKHFKISPASGYALLASFSFALSNVVIKFAVSQLSMIDVLFWGRIFTILTVFLFLLKKDWRKNFTETAKTMSALSFTLVLGNELLAFIGTLAFLTAITLTTASIITATNAVYTFFVFMIGLVYASIKPEWKVEDTSRFALITKLASLALLVPGLVLVS